jgi:ABC-type multidrug transport system ATPase subunit
MSDQAAAIRVTGLTRGYGSGKKRVDVLEKLCMEVKTGTIYGLLGPSGCGKTTLLKVILGRLIPEAGEVRVLGSSPGSTGSSVPGSAVGYSPQEIALYFDLSIAETFLFHGRLHGMLKSEILAKQKWLLEFLDLPDAERQVAKLSGGQKRRVSLAVSLLHDPELLLLDEPTVGVDPELRARVWDHLKTIANQGTTVIVTTHYIDEASKADRVGLMRGGVLLAEASPEEVMESQSATSLEEAFLALCMRDNGGGGQ